MRILIVDDDAMVVESCRRILKEEGISIRMAGNTREARELLEKGERFELMLTDIKMPKQDGFQLVSQVKKKWPDMAILMMTGYLTQETIERGSQGGVEGFIAKPFTPEELVNAIWRNLEKRTAE
jgi:DNA-binding NtrC family response regulator